MKLELYCTAQTMCRHITCRLFCCTSQFVAFEAVKKLVVAHFTLRRSKTYIRDRTSRQGHGHGLSTTDSSSVTTINCKDVVADCGTHWHSVSVITIPEAFPLLVHLHHPSLCILPTVFPPQNGNDNNVTRKDCLLSTFKP